MNEKSKSMETEEKCASCGMSLHREYDAFSARYKTPIIFPSSNLRGMVSDDDIKVPHSELAMHQGAAGKPIVAYFMTRNMAFAVYAEENGGCGFVFGSTGEVLSHKMAEVTSSTWSNIWKD